MSLLLSYETNIKRYIIMQDTSGDIMSVINRIYDDPESVSRHLFDLLRSPNKDDDLQSQVNFNVIKK